MKNKTLPLMLFTLASFLLSSCTPTKRFYPVEGCLAVVVENIERNDQGMMKFSWTPPLETMWTCPGYEWYERAGTIYVRFLRFPYDYKPELPFQQVPLRNPGALPVLQSDEDGHTKELWRHIVR